MPVVDYSKIVIYKIQHESKDELLYVGSTTHFGNRKSLHKSRCYNPNGVAYNYKLYQAIRDNGGWDAFNMVVVKEFPCENKRQAEAEEDKIMREMKTSLNTVRPYVTAEEQRQNKKKTDKKYHEENKDKIKEKKHIYYEQNIEKIKEKRKQYQEENKDKIKKYKAEYQVLNKVKLNEISKKNYQQNIEQRKQYYEVNKEKINERRRKYYEANKEQIREKTKLYREANKEQIREIKKRNYQNNKEKISEKNKEKNKEKIKCKCGCILRKCGLRAHFKTKKHQTYLNQQTDQ